MIITTVLPEEVANFDANCIMESLGIESLFTNILLYETIANCINDIFPNNDIVHSFIKEDVKELRFSHLIMNIIAN